MASQMAIVIGLFIFIGRKLDHQEGVMYTLLGSLLGVSLSFYWMVKSLQKK